MDHRKIVISIFLSVLMVGTAFALVSGAGNVSSSNVKSYSNSLASTVNGASSARSFTTTTANWTYPTNTYHEPGYTNGTFYMGIDCNVNTLNYFPANTYCDVYAIDEIYDSMFTDLPNGTTIPWLATNYSVTHVTTNNTTFDVVTNSTENYSYIYTINLRPNVQWTDWTAANATQSYMYSNVTTYYNASNLTTHTFKSYKPTKMLTYYLQSADVVCSWRMEAGFGIWANVVNVIPNGNLSVKVFVTKQTLLILPDSLTNDILPYHIWRYHNFNDVGLWNCTTNTTVVNQSEGYYSWNLGWSVSTGAVPGLVGTGPFMVTNNYGIPNGEIIPSQCEKFYANPHYFVQYANASSGLRQYTPKFYEIAMPFYSSESGLIGAYEKGQVDTTSLAPDPSFLPQVSTTPGSVIYKKLSSAYGYFRINTRDAPLNITAFRQGLNYATPTSYMASVIADGYGYLSSNPINPSNTLFVNASAPEYTFDLAKAAQLIDSIPGMTNTSHGLLYNGTQVCIVIQTTVGAVAPNNIEDIEAAIQDWNLLGIKAIIKEEAFTTLEANIDSTISTNGATNGYEMAVEGISTASGNPSLGCQEFVNPVYGIPTNEYVGPFSSMSVNGHNLTGTQVQDLFDNLTTQAVNTNKFSVAQHDIKYLQSLMIDQAFMINIGYGTDLVPLQTTTFTNYSLTETNALYIYWYWQFFSIHTHHTTVVQPKYNLSVTEVLDSGSTFTAGTYGNVTFTVWNGTSTVAGADLTVGFSAPYGGIINVTSNNLVTNSKGQATWEYYVASYLAEDMKSCNATGAVVTATNQTVTITGAAVLPNAPETGAGISSINILLVNGVALHVSYSVNAKSYTTGQTGTITFTVDTVNGTSDPPYAGATLTLTLSNPVNMSAVSPLTLTTNSAGIAVFTFKATGNISSTLLTQDLAGITVSATSNNATIFGDNITLVAPVVKPVTTTNYLDYVIIGVVVAIIVIAAAALVVRSRRKKS